MEKNFYGLTNPQKSIWNMENFFEGTTINNICASIVIPKKLNINALKTSAHNVIRKNDCYRTRIIIKNNIPVQYYSDFQPFEIEVINVKNNEQFEKIKEESINYKFNIIDSNLFLFKIIIFPDEHSIFLCTFHHIIADSWSLGLFAQAIMYEYKFLINKETIAEENINSYIAFIESEKNYLQSNKYEKDKNYWVETFKDIPEVVTFSGSKKYLKINDYSSRRESFRLDFNVAKNIQEYCNINKISVFNFFMSIYSIYLSKTTGLDNFVVRNSYLKSYKFQRKTYNGNVC